MYIPHPLFRPGPRPSHASATPGAASLSEAPAHDDLRAPPLPGPVRAGSSGRESAALRQFVNAASSATDAGLHHRLLQHQRRGSIQDTNVTIGIVVGILIAVFLAAVLTFMWIYHGSIRFNRRRRRHRRKRKSNESSKSSKTSDGGGAPPAPPAGP